MSGVRTTRWFRPNILQEGDETDAPLAFRIGGPMFEVPKDLRTQIFVTLDQNLAQLGVGDELPRRVGVGIATPAGEQETPDDVGLRPSPHRRHRPRQQTRLEQLIQWPGRRSRRPQDAVP
jgi:hypothetical protein